jgi:hypothetical protein
LLPLPGRFNFNIRKHSADFLAEGVLVDELVPREEPEHPLGVLAQGGEEYSVLALGRALARNWSARAGRLFTLNWASRIFTPARK